MNFLKLFVVVMIAGLTQACSTPNQCLFDADELMGWAKGATSPHPGPRAERHQRDAELVNRNGNLHCFAAEMAHSSYVRTGTNPNLQPAQQFGTAPEQGLQHGQ